MFSENYFLQTIVVNIVNDIALAGLNICLELLLDTHVPKFGIYS